MESHPASRVPAGCPAARSSRRWPPGATTASGTSTVQSYGKGRSAGFIRAGTRAPVVPTEPQRHTRLCTRRPSAAQLGRGDIIDYAPYGTVLQECVLRAQHPYPILTRAAAAQGQRAGSLGAAHAAQLDGDAPHRLRAVASAHGLAPAVQAAATQGPHHSASWTVSGHQHPPAPSFPHPRTCSKACSPPLRVNNAPGRLPPAV